MVSGTFQKLHLPVNMLCLLDFETSSFLGYATKPQLAFHEALSKPHPTTLQSCPTFIPLKTEWLLI